MSEQIIDMLVAVQRGYVPAQQLTAAQAANEQLRADLARQTKRADALAEHMRLVRKQEAEVRRSREDRIIALTDQLATAEQQRDAAFAALAAYQSYVDNLILRWVPATEDEKAHALTLWARVEAATARAVIAGQPAARRPEASA